MGAPVLGPPAGRQAPLADWRDTGTHRRAAGSLRMACAGLSQAGDRSALWLLGFPHWPRLQLSKRYGPRHRAAPSLGQPQVGRRIDHGTSRPHDLGAEPGWGCSAIVGARLRGTLEAAEPWDGGLHFSPAPDQGGQHTPGKDTSRIHVKSRHGHWTHSLRRDAPT